MSEELTKDGHTVTPDDTGPGPVSLLCDAEWQNLCEKDDRTSPAEYPEMCLINQAEVGALICEGYLLAKDQDRAALSVREGEVEELRRALEPFAKEADAHEARGFWSPGTYWSAPMAAFRDARAALSPKGGE